MGDLACPNCGQTADAKGYLKHCADKVLARWLNPHSTTVG